MTNPLLERFAAALHALNSPCLLPATPADAAQAVIAALQERSISEVVAWADPVLEQLGLPDLAREAGIAWETASPETADTAVRATAARAGAGVTTADRAVAETGTLLITSGPGKPRSAAVLPPLHIAVVPQERLLSSQSALFAHLSLLALTGPVPSAINLITGPSRSGDIEDILVRKVHGPGELIVVVVPATDPVEVES
ncbi:MAG: LutC/YkgG family protein [Bacillota bacterium]